VVALLEETLGTMLEAGQITDAAIAQTETQRRQMWAAREAAGEITLNQHPMVDCDIAVPLDKVETFLARMGARLSALDPGATDVVVSHLGDGNIHYTAFPSRNEAGLLDAIRDAVDDVTVGLHGSFSAEHGIGLSKLASMRARKDPVALDMMRRLKQAFDPAGILNPGKTLP
jgi:FAD/FMN-containing dehydrogenase